MDLTLRTSDNDFEPPRQADVLPQGGFEEFVWEVRHKLAAMVARLSAPLDHDSDELFEVTRDLYALRSVASLLELPHCASVAGRCGMRLREVARRGSELTHMDRSAVMRALKVLTQMFERVQQDHNDLECRQHMLQAISILED